MAADVLGTWRRIIEGEEDRGGELGDGEQRVRNYLSNISNQALVQEYGLWLASRNPKLGVQVFTDEKGKAPRFEHAQVVSLLREEAPDAAKYYLEHLVFGKGSTAYVNELITYYLDIVITELETSPQSRDNLSASYDSYRALQAPKPTYLRFLTDNAPPQDEFWQSRLRLLQLLGGGHDYDAAAVRKRIERFKFQQETPGGAHHETTPSPPPEQKQMLHQEPLLVPEAIILATRARQHDTALHLLVHRLGDHDTAVSYCLRGGAAALATPSSFSSSFPSASPPQRKPKGVTADDDDLPPTFPEQTVLFGILLREFLGLPDRAERVAQTGALLERFAGWFDVLDVLARLPDDWAVDAVEPFLTSALRRLVRERREAVVGRALSGAENLRVGWEFVEEVGGRGPVVVVDEGGGEARDEEGKE
ncbi:hypothetical protein VTK26DRAFT_3798 [Humicola hyalothermophila]